MAKLYRQKGSRSWWVTYHDASGKRHRRSTRKEDRAEAEAVLLRIQHRIAIEKLDRS